MNLARDLAFCVVVAVLLPGCVSHVDSSKTMGISRTTTEGEVKGRPSLSMPIMVPGQTTCIVPFAIEDRKGWFDDRDPYTKGGYGDSYRGSYTPASAPALYSHGGQSRWHNAVIRDMKTGEEWTVLDRRGVISRYEMFVRHGKQDEPPVSLGLVFIATIEDTNGDGALDDRDATVALAAEADGRRPRIVTPARGQVWSTAYDARVGLMYFYVVEDSNGDGQYTPDDSPRPYVLDPRGNAVAAPLVSGDSARRVEGLLK